MMDLRCPVCGEPMDLDELHYVAEDSGRTFDEVRKEWARSGCVALGYTHNEQPNRMAADFSAALHDLLGDDVDGIASELDDAEYMGWI